jgi:tRNA pseudouridine55 synthase
MIHGIVNVLKPTGMSSHDVVGQLRHIYGMKKIGHAGTLDPLAAGVLPVYLGQAARLIEYGDNAVKSYHAEFLLGFATDTEDITGQVVAESTAPLPAQDQVEAALEQFRGTIEQTPSRFSAVNVNGVKAYKLARHHVDFLLPSRSVEISELRLAAYSHGWGILEVTCSKGTYIRSLIRDLGEALGTFATMSYLVRVRAGVFTIANAASLEELEQDPKRYILPMDLGIQELQRITLDEAGCKFLLQGRPVAYAEHGLKEREVLRIYSSAGVLAGIAVFDWIHQVIRPHKMFADVL